MQEDCGKIFLRILGIILFIIQFLVLFIWLNDIKNVLNSYEVDYGNCKNSN